MANDAVLSIGIDSSSAVKGVTKLNTSYDKLIKKTKQSDRALKNNNQVMVKGKRSVDLMSTSVKGLSSSISTLLVPLAGLTTLLSIGAIGSNFEDSMLKVKGVTKATEEQFERLTQTALKMGETTRFSASESAEALNFLGMAGINANDSIKALPVTLNLASAGNIDLATSADIASNAMTAMGLEVGELDRVADVFANTITSSNTDMTQLAEAFKFAAPLAKTTGITIEQLSASIGILGNSGIQASLAGTGLRQAMAELLKPSDKLKTTFASMGVVLDKNLITSLHRMRDAGIDSETVFKNLGLRGGQAVSILLDNVDALDKLTQSNMNSAGSAKTLADIMESGVGGSFRGLKSLIESVAIDLFEFSKGGITNMLQLSIESIRGFKEIAKESKGTTTFIADIFRSTYLLLQVGLIEFVATAKFLFLDLGDAFSFPIKIIKIGWNELLGTMRLGLADFLTSTTEKLKSIGNVTFFGRKILPDFSQTITSIGNYITELEKASEANFNLSSGVILTNKETEKQKLIIAQLRDQYTKDAGDKSGLFDVMESGAKSATTATNILKDSLKGLKNFTPSNTSGGNEKTPNDPFDYDSLADSANLFASSMMGAESSVNDFGDAYVQTVDKMKDLNNSFADSFTDSIISSLDNGKLSFKSFFDDVKNQAKKAFFEKNITSNLFGAIGKDGSRDGTGLLGSVLSGIFHTGSNDRNTRSVPASTFNNAPRYHNGLQAGELPAILRNDESVLTPAQMRATGGKTTVIVNNNSTETASVQESQDSNGDNIIEIIIGEVKRSVGEGDFNNELRLSGAFQ